MLKVFWCRKVFKNDKTSLAASVFNFRIYTKELFLLPYLKSFFFFGERKSEHIVWVREAHINVTVREWEKEFYTRKAGIFNPIFASFTIISASSSLFYNDSNARTERARVVKKGERRSLKTEKSFRLWLKSGWLSNKEVLENFLDDNFLLFLLVISVFGNFSYLLLICLVVL